jgi:type I restriction enzyme S subunit
MSIPPHGLLTAFNEAITVITDQLRILCFQSQKLRAARDLLLPRLMSGELAV